jgi:hypothetical protein
MLEESDKIILIKEQHSFFIEQIREEVSQLFILNGFFFGVESALIGAVFLKSFEYQLIPAIHVVGVSLTFFWFLIIYRKNEARKRWLERIEEIENRLGIEKDFQMWPEKAAGGLSQQLFFWPIGFFGIVWLLLPFIYDKFFVHLLF